MPGFVRTSVSKPDERPALMQHQPTALDAELETGLVFRRRRLQLEQHRAVDRLDEDAAILYRFEGVSQFEELACACPIPRK